MQNHAENIELHVLAKRLISTEQSKKSFQDGFRFLLNHPI